MKKILIALTIVISCLGISRVNAESVTEISYTDFYLMSGTYYVSDYSYLKELGYDNKVQDLYNLLLNKYSNEYSNDYPYFAFSFVISSGNSSFDDIKVIYAYLNFFNDIPSLESNVSVYSNYLHSSYDISSTTTYTPVLGNSTHWLTPIIDNSVDAIYNPFEFFIANFDLINDREKSYNITGNSNFTVNSGDVIKPVFTVENAFQTNYTEINLNDYAYVALALKDYSEEYFNSILYEQGSFTTNVYVKGNYCITPVYNYGMTERKDILEGTKVERCSPYYESYTPVRTYVTISDMDNKSIYYVKAYDTSKENYIKVDTSVFDITYITEENKDNPYVTIGGKTYPTIPYDSLTDTATKSEDEGYVSGAVEEFSFADIFTAPLEFLKDVWSSITSVFSLITELLSLLPPIMQNFLYASFMLAVVIGLIKIIL